MIVCLPSSVCCLLPSSSWKFLLTPSNLFYTSSSDQRCFSLWIFQENLWCLPSSQSISICSSILVRFMCPTFVSASVFVTTYVFVSDFASIFVSVYTYISFPVAISISASISIFLYIPLQWKCWILYCYISDIFIMNFFYFIHD